MAKLECVDCHLLIDGDLVDILAQMQNHVRYMHRRELVYSKDKYEKEFWTEQEVMLNRLLLNPELLAAS